MNKSMRLALSLVEARGQLAEIPQGARRDYAAAARSLSDTIYDGLRWGKPLDTVAAAATKATGLPSAVVRFYVSIAFGRIPSA